MAQQIFRTTILFVYFLSELFATATRPLAIIAHRGSSGEYPDLTMEAFRLAADQGADLLELDLCVTGDGHLVVIHEVALSLSTNVANKTEFQSRRRSINVTTTAKSKTDQTRLVDDWILTDFTLSEIRRIQKRQRLNFRNPKFDGLLSIPTFAEVISFIKERKTVGLLIELKHPSFFNKVLRNSSTSSFTMEQMVINDLKRFDLHVRKEDGPKIILQSFEEDSVSEMLRITNLPVVLLQDYGYPTDEQLKQWKDKGLYGVGPQKATLMGIRTANEFKGYKQTFDIPHESQIVKRTHDLGLKVFVWTLRNEDRYLAWNFGNDPIKEIQTFIGFKVDGIITDFPATVKFVLTCSGNRLVPFASTILISAFLSKILINTLTSGYC